MPREELWSLCWRGASCLPLGSRLLGDLAGGPIVQFLSSFLFGERLRVPREETSVSVCVVQDSRGVQGELRVPTSGFMRALAASQLPTGLFSQP